MLKQITDFYLFEWRAATTRCYKLYYLYSVHHQIL